MNERVQQLLDHELPRHAATPADVDEAARMEALVGGVLRAIPTAPLPDLGPAVLQRIEALSPARPPRANPLASVRNFLDWLWHPRALSLTWRPAYAMAVALVLLVPMLLRSPAAPPAASAPPQILVQFRLDAPNATGVALAGNFTDWQPRYQLTRTAGGVWTVTVPLTQGVHKYAFVVDGHTWKPDPLAPSVDDGFGGANSQIAVLSPDVSAET